MLVVGGTIFVETTTRVASRPHGRQLSRSRWGRSCRRSRATSPGIGGFAGDSDYESPSA